jgi:hypothetical protein
MKKIRWEENSVSDELRPEYEFDYRNAKPNRFAARFPPGGRLIALDPDVAAQFQDSQEVNAVLRALLQTMPQHRAMPIQPSSSQP